MVSHTPGPSAAVHASADARASQRRRVKTVKFSSNESDKKILLKLTTIQFHGCWQNVHQEVFGLVHRVRPCLVFRLFSPLPEGRNHNPLERIGGNFERIFFRPYSSGVPLLFIPAGADWNLRLQRRGRQLRGRVVCDVLTLFVTSYLLFCCTPSVPYEYTHIRISYRYRPRNA